uniref:Uncharacterized protein n=1 Tax=Spongospora subterranea TaxID=70186 RepID=A0A0H5QVF5_9EUKA|eukprot:CRZ05727.1 hypothetical protein [Spongospora subterranea]
MLRLNLKAAYNLTFLELHIQCCCRENSPLVCFFRYSPDDDCQYLLAWFILQVLTFVVQLNSMLLGLFKTDVCRIFQNNVFFENSTLKVKSQRNFTHNLSFYPSITLCW